mgnify:CR=1 FL=1
MKFYETLYILDPNIENKSLDNLMGEVGKELVKTKSKVINHRLWNKKRLAYPIDRHNYGSYVILQYEGGEQEKMVDYDTWMRLNSAILRHITVKLDEKPETHVDKKDSDSTDDQKNVDVQESKDEIASKIKSEDTKDSGDEEKQKILQQEKDI